MTIIEALRHSKIGGTEAEIILSALLKKDRSFVKAFPESLVSKPVFYKFKNLSKRREAREPIAYILGFKEFFGLKFKVDHRVMIPRPETEALVEKAIDFTNHRKLKTPIIVDVGTGSGCVAVSLAKHLPQAKIYAVDVSTNVLELAKANALLNNVKNKITFLKGSLIGPIKSRVDLVVANLPYIPSEKVDLLQPEISLWEPRVALDGGKDGMNLYNSLFAQSEKLLKSSGGLFYEVDGKIFLYSVSKN